MVPNFTAELSVSWYQTRASDSYLHRQQLTDRKVANRPAAPLREPAEWLVAQDSPIELVKAGLASESHHRLAALPATVSAARRHSGKRRDKPAGMGDSGKEVYKNLLPGTALCSRRKPRILSHTSRLCQCVSDPSGETRRPERFLRDRKHRRSHRHKGYTGGSTGNHSARTKSGCSRQATA